MDEENDENSCGICYQTMVEPRVLPCWHVACLHCILGMTQTGQGRAVSCHICRMTFLFENIRSLPRPMNCKVCGNPVKSPKKFPCCDDLYCTACIKSRSVDGFVACGNLCTTTSHPVNELPPAKLCQICFRLHTEPARNCGHSSCSHCYVTAQGEPRPCSVCQAIAAPNPVPQNPQAPMGVNVQEFLRRMNVPGHGLDAADVRLIQQIGGIVQRLNVQNEAQRAQIQPFDSRRYNEKDMINDLPKILLFYFTLLLMLYRYGLSGWSWIVPALAMLSMRPKLQTCLGVLLLSDIGILLYGLYYQFYQALVLVIIQSLFIAAVTRSTGTRLILLQTILSITSYTIVIIFLEPLFLYTRPIGCIFVIFNTILLQGRDYLV